MTIGSWSTGPNTDLQTYGFKSGKNWSGTDGKYTANAGQRQLKWNSYQMSHLSARIGEKPTSSSNWCAVLLSSGSISTVDISTMRVGTLSNGGGIGAPSLTMSRFDSEWTARMEVALLQKLLNKVKGHSYNVGVSLAEVDKLASSVVSSVKQLGFGAWDLCNKRYEAFARRFGTYPPNLSVTRKLNTMDFSGRFLEMSYCWIPTVNDTYEAAKAFEALSNGPRSKVFRASKTVTIKVTEPSTWLVRQLNVKMKRTYTYEAYEELSFLRQIGLGNPASILWERIPYSFVLDWFYPIGTYLEQIGQIPHLKGRFLRSDTMHYSGGGVISAPPNGVGTRAIAWPEFSYLSHFQMRRTPLASLSVPTPTLKVVGSVHGRRIGNALALAHQVFGNCADFLVGKPILHKGRIRYVDDGIQQSLLSRLRRI